MFLGIDSFFGSILKEEPDVSAGVAAIRTLLKVLENDKCMYKVLTFKKVLKIMSF